MSRKIRYKYLLLLNLLFMVFSVTGVLSKLAAGQPYLSPAFFVFYGLMLAVLAIYSVGWQRLLKFLPLSLAYMNKGAAVIWAVIWGLLFFHEQIKLNQIIGIAIVLAGVCMAVSENG